MKSLRRLRRLISLALTVVIAVAAEGCAVFADHNEVISASGIVDPQAPRLVVVLFDGTRNSPDSKTNVWAMKTAVEASGQPALVDYIPGVGTAKAPVTGSALGLTMEEGIHKGYRFLSSNARSQDKILIFGFSRGAHQARALAGFVSYAGLMDTDGLSERKMLVEANKILEITKGFDDSDLVTQFSSKADVPPLMEKVSTETGNRMRAATIDFLGVWDTVPGSSFLEFENCREKPNSKPGERYKTGSYPLIKKISHAVSIDEKRSKFYPILLCTPIVPGLTTTSEVWFAGAHADVGGGYPDGELQSISLVWMVDEASPVTGGALPIAAAGSPLGRAHWSFGDGAASFRSNCEDRVVPTDVQLHPSVLARRQAGRAPVVVDGVQSMEPYPRSCDR